MTTPQSPYLYYIYTIGMNLFSFRYVLVFIILKTQGRTPKRDIDILQARILGAKNEKIRCSLCEYPFTRINLVGIIIYSFN